MQSISIVTATPSCLKGPPLVANQSQATLIQPTWHNDFMASTKTASLSLAFLLAVTACTPQNPQDLKEKTARATEAMKRNARAVAAGIREGWSRDKPLDLNGATKEELLRLPGMTSAEADRVITGRPYQQPSDLITRHILPKSEYDKIADLVKVKK